MATAIIRRDVRSTFSELVQFQPNPNQKGVSVSIHIIYELFGGVVIVCLMVSMALVIDHAIGLKESRRRRIGRRR